jgi:hypothetical protein
MTLEPALSKLKISLLETGQTVFVALVESIIVVPKHACVAEPGTFGDYVQRRVEA